MVNQVLASRSFALEPDLCRRDPRVLVCFLRVRWEASGAFRRLGRGAGRPCYAFPSENMTLKEMFPSWPRLCAAGSRPRARHLTCSRCAADLRTSRSERFFPRRESPGPNQSLRGSTQFHGNVQSSGL